MKCTASFALILVTLLTPHQILADDVQFAAQDSLNVRDVANSDAAACLKGFSWEPNSFEVSLTKPGEEGDFLVRYRSPISTGDAINDMVSMVWHQAKDLDGNVRDAPAILVVHESGRRMEVGRMFARSLRDMGFHTFQIHLPHYGARSNGKHPADAATLLTRVRQGVADTRRAYDAIKVLPHVRGGIAIQGTSLGGFVAALAGGVDGCFDSVHLLLAGGDLYEMMQNGQKETAKVRRKLEEQGISGDRLKSLLYMMEPTRLAHRLDPQKTWMYTAIFDTVVPKKNADALSKAISLTPEHYIQFPANHYSGVIFIPLVLKNVAQVCNGEK